VHPDTVRRWRRKGEDFDSHGGSPAEWEIFAIANREIRAARARFLGRLIRDAVSSDEAQRWRRALEVLRRRDRDNWAPPSPQPNPLDELEYNPDERFL